jgi:hypothetical protein
MSAELSTGSNVGRAQMAKLANWQRPPEGYVTSVFQLVAHRLRSAADPFARVSFLSLLTEKSSMLVPLFPDHGLLIDFKERAARATQYINFDPASVRPVKNSDGIVGAGYMLQPETVKRFFAR